MEVNAPFYDGKGRKPVLGGAGAVCFLGLRWWIPVLALANMVAVLRDTAKLL